MNTENLNLFVHADGGFYCLIASDAPMKSHNDWVPGVVYTGVDGIMRSTTRERWDERFYVVQEYLGDDEGVLMMIRRCNPGDRDLDFVRVFESWHETEVNLTSEMLTLAVAAAIIKLKPEGDELTIMTSDLHKVSQNYDINKEPIPHGFVFSVRKSFPK